MNWFMLLFMAIYVVLGLALVVKAKRFNSISCNPEPEKSAEFNEKLNKLACLRIEIENMPAGYRKVKAQEMWLKELNTLMASDDQHRQPAENVVQFRHINR